MITDPLLTTFQLKHLTLKNRIMISSHEPAYPHDGMPKDRYRAYHEERAKAGVALTMTAGSAAVAPDSPPVFNNILAYKDEVVPWLQRLTDACHEHDCAVMIQLTHLGRRTGWNKGDWLPVISSSHSREPAHRAFPKKMEVWDFERIVKDFADAAERMQAGGMDGIELQAYGHLIDQVWSPLTNTQESPYGGSLENRMKFSMDILSAIRERVGKQFIIGVRYTADELNANGISPEEGIEISKHLRDCGMVDFLNVVRGRIHTDPAMTDVIPVQGMPSAPHLDFAGEVRRISGMPTFHASKIADVATARHAISQGLLDMVGMTRAHIAEPHLVAKIAQGQEDDIRPCVGATYCLDRIYQAGEALCIHNAATGRELTMPHSIAISENAKRVVIVGAGPAGMEAARVASERGHKVVVFEAADKLGGQVRLTAESRRRREMIGIIDWRFDQCIKRGVEFRLDYWAEAQDVINEAPDVVIIATGGLPETEILSKGNNLVDSTWDIISRNISPAKNVLIFDDAGDHPALQAAEIIANSGAKLEVMTPDRSFAPDIMAMNLVPYMRSLQDKEVTFTVARRLLEVEENQGVLRATIGTDYSDFTQEAHYDQIIVNHGTIPLDDLYFQLKEGSINLGELDYKALIAGEAQTINRNPQGTYQLFRIGDAVSGRNTHAAIYDALRLLKDI
jgi:2,4-dienoyl-CoA reductase-like NADH-dependent reductase (Old Yellow Enzyme family)/thioredoxin reductase